MPKYFPYELQPIRIPPNWRVTYNIWFEVDPAPETMEWFNESMMLGIQSDDRRYFIDLAFAPEDDPSGRFLVTFYAQDDRQASNSDDARVIGGGEFRERLDALQSIEHFMADVWQAGLPHETKQ